MSTNEVDHTYNSLNQQLHSFHSNQTIRSPSANRVNDALQPPSLPSALPTLPATTYSRPAPASPKRLSLSTNLVDHSLGKRHDVRDSNISGFFGNVPQRLIAHLYQVDFDYPAFLQPKTAVVEGFGGQV